MHLLSDSPVENENLPKNLGSPKQLWFQSVIKIGSFLKFAKIAPPSAANAYKKYRNLLTRIKYKAKQNYYQYLFSTCQKNSSKTWATIHDIIGKKKEGSVIPKVVINQDNQKVTNLANV